MHVVNEVESEDRFQESAEEYRLFVSMNNIISVPDQEPDSASSDKHIQKEFEHRRSGLDVSEPRKPGATKNTHVRNIRIATLTVGQQINLCAQFRKNKRSIVDAEGRASWREKRLR
jgi:hypothetical protein